METGQGKSLFEIRQLFPNGHGDFIFVHIIHQLLYQFCKADVPLNCPSQLHSYKGHPFRVLDDEKMQETVESVKKYGILVPGIVRPHPDGGYEVVAGHRRWRACELAGLEEMPVILFSAHCCSSSPASLLPNRNLCFSGF